MHEDTIKNKLLGKKTIETTGEKKSKLDSLVIPDIPQEPQSQQELFGMEPTIIKQTKPKETTKPVTFSMLPSVKNKLKMLADQNSTSASKVLEDLINDAFNKM